MEPVPVPVRMEFDWLFHASMEPDKPRLIKELRATVMHDISALFYACSRRLRKAGQEVQSTTQTEYCERIKGQETVFTFIGVLVNRDLPPGAAVLVAPTKQIIEAMGNAWETAATTTLGSKPVDEC